jgi:hypothetical protein
MAKAERAFVQVKEFLLLRIKSLYCLKREMLPKIHERECDVVRIQSRRSRSLRVQREMVSKYALSSFLVLTTYRYS